MKSIFHYYFSQFNMAFKQLLFCGKYGKEKGIASIITQSSLTSTSFTEKGEDNNGLKT